MLELYDEVIEKKSKDNPMITEIVASQKKFAERAVKWEQDVVVSRTMAYNHYFGPKAAPAAERTASIQGRGHRRRGVLRAFSGNAADSFLAANHEGQ